jgi:hypothetical protein
MNNSVYSVSQSLGRRAADGSSPASLAPTRFVKVQTGIFLMTEGFGEISTEIVVADGLPRQDGGFTQ